MTDYPTIRMRPKGGRRLSDGAPWVYADEIAMDRRAKARPAGDIVRLEDAERTARGVFAFNPGVTIAARLLDADPDARIDTAWFAARLSRALAMREMLFDAPFYRLIHAEGDGLPGVVIDRFGDALVIQPNAAWADVLAPALLDAAEAVLSPKIMIVNAASRARTIEGLSEVSEIRKGALDAPIPTRMNGAIYMADLVGGQKTGLYFDQRPNHAFAATLTQGRRVLDMFSHVGGFSLACLAQGAESALAVDGSEPALALAREGAAATGVADRFETRHGQAFETMRALAEEGRTFDVVICDPPAFAPNRGALANGLRAYEKTARLGARLVEPGGYLALCSCSHAADLETFTLACRKGIGAAGRSGALIRIGGAGPDHPVHLALPETGYLKALFYRLDG